MIDPISPMEVTGKALFDSTLCSMAKSSIKKRRQLDNYGIIDMENNDKVGVWIEKGRVENVKLKSTVLVHRIYGSSKNNKRK